MQIVERLLQFLRELRFIEAGSRALQVTPFGGCSSFGNCTSLRPCQHRGRLIQAPGLQFLRELHFIETGGDRYAYRGY